MKWIKASERLPEKIEDVTKNSYSVKCYNRKDAIYWCDNNWQWIGTSYKLSERDFNTLEWLDESQASDKDKEIERLKGLIEENHKRWYKRTYNEGGAERSWAIFKNENNL